MEYGVDHQQQHIFVPFHAIWIINCECNDVIINFPKFPLIVCLPVLLVSIPEGIHPWGVDACVAIGYLSHPMICPCVGHSLDIFLPYLLFFTIMEMLQ